MPQRTVFDHLPPGERMAAQILDRLYHLGSECTKRQLARQMSAHKKPLWKPAFELLVQRGYIRLTDMHTRRQVMVALVEIPKRYDPKPIIIRKKIKRRRKRTPWFEERLPKFRARDGYGNGPDEEPTDATGHDSPPPQPAEPRQREEPEEFWARLIEPPGWRKRDGDDEGSL